VRRRRSSETEGNAETRNLITSFMLPSAASLEHCRSLRGWCCAVVDGGGEEGAADEEGTTKLSSGAAKIDA
jgi:hypothetical protein